VEEALKYGALSANISSQEPIDVVMHESCENHETIWDQYKQVKFVPFNPTDKYTIASVVPNDGSPPFRLMKGAPQVLSTCPMTMSYMLTTSHCCVFILYLVAFLTFGLASGRIQVVLRNSANKAAISAAVEEKIVEFANRGYRALGLSRAQGLEGMPTRSHSCSVLGSPEIGPYSHAVRLCR